MTLKIVIFRSRSPAYSAFCALHSMVAGCNNCRVVIANPSFEGKEKSMRTSAKSLLAILHVGTAGALGIMGAQAQNLTIFGENHIALKSGESQELSEIYYQTGCISQLKSVPRVEIVEAPPGVTAELREAMVLPRFQKCATPIKGAKLWVSVKNVEDPSYSPLVVRIVYDTREGERKEAHIYNLFLTP